MQVQFYYFISLSPRSHSGRRVRYNGNGVWLMASLRAHQCGLRPGEDFRMLFPVAIPVNQLRGGSCSLEVVVHLSALPPVATGKAELEPVLRTKQVVSCHSDTEL